MKICKIKILRKNQLKQNLVFFAGVHWNHQVVNTVCKRKSLRLPPGNFNNPNPIWLLSMYWSSDITKYLAIQTNLFSK